MTENHPTKPGLIVAAAIGTIVLAMLGIALIALDLLEEAGGRHIEDAPQPPLTITLVCGLGLLVAAGWAVWLARERGVGNLITRIVASTAVILLIVTPIVGWQAFSSDRQLTIVTSTCDAESLRNRGGDLRNGCSDEAVDTIVLLEGVDGDTIWVPDATNGNLTREFSDLPAGNWEAKLTVDGPPETVTVGVVAERDGEPVRLATLRPYADPESDRLRWSGVIPVDGDVTDLQVQFFLSQNPAVESARIRFDVRECAGQNARAFDASLCEPMEANSPLVYEQTPEGARTWRQLYVTREGQSFFVSNLEARTYTLQPDYVNIEKATQSTDVLVIPAAMDQVAANSITAPGESSFEVQIDTNTGELTFNIYVFPAGPTFAHRH